MKPTVSLIIPLYNAETYLAACLESVAAQTIFADTQVLLIDDGSTDGSPQICDAFADRYENVQVQHRENAGVSAARNAGIDAAEGKYIAFADADDWLMPETLERLCDAAERTGAQLAICDFLSDPPEGEERTSYTFVQDRAFPVSEVASFMLENETCNALWNKLFVRQIVQQSAVRMTVGKPVGEDREFVLRYLACCTHAVYIHFAGYYYRYLANSAIRRPRTGYAAMMTLQYQSDQQLFAALGFDRDEFARRCASCFCTRICLSIGLICRAYSGAERRRMLCELYADDTLQEILASLLPHARSQMNRFSLCLLLSMQRRSVRRTFFWMWALRCRMLLHRITGR